jgi:CheY-like chemotaxis protein
MSTDKTIAEMLAQKRFALVGFNREQAARIADVLETANGFPVTLPLEALEGERGALEPFNLVILEAAPALFSDPPAPVDQVARAGKPALLIGDALVVTTHADALADVGRHFLLRPWGPDELLLRAYCAVRQSEQSGDRERRRRRDPLVLLADDDDTTTTLVAEVLRGAKLRCDVARDGVQALALSRKLRPDVLLLDVSMPTLGGFDVLTELRADPVTRDIKVVMLTSDRREDDIVRGFTLGVEDYITKPFNPREMVARVARVLSHTPREITI